MNEEYQNQDDLNAEAKHEAHRGHDYYGHYERHSSDAPGRPHRRRIGSYEPRGYEAARPAGRPDRTRTPRYGAEGNYDRPYGEERRPRYGAGTFQRNDGTDRHYADRQYPRANRTWQSRDSYGAERTYGQRPAGRPDYQRYQNDAHRDYNPSGGQGGYANRGQRPYVQGNRRPGQRFAHNNNKRITYKEQPRDPNEPIRLNKYLANAGICSRRDADKYIAAGVVTVSGQVVTELGTKVLCGDVVQFHDAPVKIERKIYVLLNKPKGYVTTSDDPQNRRIVMDLVRGACRERIYPVGRLDRNTTGVLLLTNDGELASKLTHPKFLKKKIYHVHADHNVSPADLQQMMSGIALEDGEIRADAADYANETDRRQVGVEIHSGRNRIVRRMFEHLGYHVQKLDRVYFAGLTKKGLKRGDWRFLTEKEVSMLQMGAFE